jgi:hypothetical protein
MKSFVSKLFVVGCLTAALGLAWTVADGQEGKKKKQQAKADPTAKVKKSVAEADLPADVREKAEKIIAEHAPKLREAQAKFNAATTQEQRQAANAARKAAKDAGRKGKAVQEEALAAMKLTDEQKSKYEAAQAELQAAQQALNRDLRSVLSPEQQSAVGLPKQKKKKNAN